MHVFLVCWDAVVRAVGDHHWLTIVTGIGAVATATGVAVGGIFAAHYGRRASASVSAAVVDTPRGPIVTVRPVVKAVGIFRVKFQMGRGSVLRIEETSLDATTGRLVPGDHKDFEGVFDGMFVEAGEELKTTVVFDRPPLSESTVGWNVYLKVGAPTQWNRLRRSASGWWLDQTFVARHSP
jgi:hypothetical protein